MEVLVCVVAVLVVAFVLPLSQAALASARWRPVLERGELRGAGAYREASVPITRVRWRGVHPSVIAACVLGVLWAFATFCFSLAGAFLPPAWPVAISGFVLSIVLLRVTSHLACRQEDAASFVRTATTYSFIHHGAVVLTFLALSTWGSMAEVLLFTLVACAIGVAITAYLRASLHTEIERRPIEPRAEETTTAE